MRAVLSLIVALVASVAGHLLLWGGGSANLQSVEQTGGAGAGDLTPQILAIVGVLLVAVALLTAAWSSVGVIVVGIVHVVAGFVAVVVPPIVVMGPIRWIDGVNGPVGDGVSYSWPTGVQLLTGAIFLVVGISTAARLPRSSAAARAVTLVLAVVLGLGVVPLMVLGGYRMVQAMIRVAPVVELLGLLLVLGAAVVVAIIAATVRWSSLGVLVIGIVFAAAGAYALVATEQVVHLVDANPPFAVGTSYLGATGNLLLLGLLLLVAGIAGIARATRRRRALREAEPEAEESIGYQPERPGDQDDRPTDDLGRAFPPTIPLAGPPRDGV
jgi:hypothetical protein